MQHKLKKGLERSSPMSSSQEYLTTQEFAQKSGVSASTVSKWIRADKIRGHKKNGKWLIPMSEISKITPSKGGSTATSSTAPSMPGIKKATETETGGKHYSIQEFSALTYLTEFGVGKWLKEGRLIPAYDRSGKPMVASSNLDEPNIKRLVR
jgi:excisionase family DNA binding protein